ncbi:nickel pincer cofactor biosynthesis protein LarB [Oceanispirochaeta sp.]|jgi:NCAIR mutase (PurE)-related protein|uniref:nickel pincer cofactor biosynthesis protein LarB n=1 Tax=Oceanispirochaeta sp. TaxID=2035350 RepID=UPI00262C2496|nr:nickel pincer cofactor biosynthesis protein LarB [Oceanispirochaeta sp.]MDA3956861.1 nickel pincer cofactor biosynthesis protein LarB [Oceanispirochaeta sp.]
MQNDDVLKILESYKQGSFSLEEAEQKVHSSYFSDLGHTMVDNNRRKRSGASEVIYCAGKTEEQIAHIFAEMNKRGDNILGTRASHEAYQAVKKIIPSAEYDVPGRTITLINRDTPLTETSIAIVSAGTSDLPVAREACVTAEFYGNRVQLISDVGVAGIHRLFNHIEEIRKARVVIVIAGMEGALPSVVGGLVDKPVIAVPTSVGYGAAFGGLAALLGMLNSCSSGISVVNIDNGFGAAFQASMINHL